MPPRLPEVSQTKLQVAHLVDATTEFRNHTQQTKPLQARPCVRFHMSLLGVAGYPLDFASTKLRNIPQQTEPNQARLCVLFHNVASTPFWVGLWPPSHLVKDLARLPILCYRQLQCHVGSKMPVQRVGNLFVVLLVPAAGRRAQNVCCTQLPLVRNLLGSILG